MVKRTPHVMSATGFNFLQTDLTTAIEKFNGIYPDPEILFLGTYSIDYLHKRTKDIHTRTVTQKVSATMFVTAKI